MNPHLFVYGTLQQSFTNPFAQRLHANGSLLGAARIPGKLYLLGNRDFQYPGAVYDPQASTWVQGELWRMHTPQPLLASLDEYEGITPATPPPHEYQRLELSVTTGHTSTLAWCYVLNRPVAESSLIRSGKFGQ